MNGSANLGKIGQRESWFLGGAHALSIVYQILVNCGWNFLDGQPGVRTNIVCLLEGPSK